MSSERNLKGREWKIQHRWHHKCGSQGNVSFFSLSSEQAIIKWTKIGIQSHSYLPPWDYTTFRDNKKQGLVSVDLGSNLHKGLIFQCSAHSNFVPHFSAHCISPGTTEHYVHSENSLSAPFWGSLSITNSVLQHFISYSKLNASSIVNVLQLCSWTPFWIFLCMSSPWAQKPLFITPN